jgi:caffeoyl-CoA O-methyltransferase
LTISLQRLDSLPSVFKPLDLTADLHRYLLDHSQPLGDLAEQLISETARLGEVAGMQLAPEQAMFLRLLVQISGAKRAIEVGTFTGLSSLIVAESMGKEGRLVCLDLSEEWTRVARRYWSQAGVDDRIELRLGPALQSLRGMSPNERFDFALIDADKGNYINYYEEILERLAPGGLVVSDNVLWSGRVIHPHDTEVDTAAIRAFNEHVAADPRSEVIILPLGDGLSVARRL